MNYEVISNMSHTQQKWQIKNETIEINISNNFFSTRGWKASKTTHIYYWGCFGEIDNQYTNNLEMSFFNHHKLHAMYFFTITRAIERP
jgi:hypothetical protein